MKLHILGGVKEYGRVCFGLQGTTSTLLLDCGVHKDKSLSEAKRFPCFSMVNPSMIDFVFMTHSHADHWGGLYRLVQCGFKGKVVCTSYTKNQILSLDDSNVLSRHLDWMTLASDNTHQPLRLADDLTVHWGPNGHLLGSVWFLLHVEGKVAFYSGDYSPESVIYHHNLPSSNAIDLAIIDNGYGRAIQSQTIQLDQLESAVKETLKRTGNVLLPLPFFGRSQELLFYLSMAFSKTHYPIYVEQKIYHGLLNALDDPFYLRKESVGNLQERLALATVIPFDAKRWQHLTNNPPALILVGDGMMETPLSQDIYQYLNEDDLIVLTGHQSKGTFGERLLSRVVPKGARVLFLRYLVHQGEKQVCDMLQKIHSKNVILYHSKEHESINHEQLADRFAKMSFLDAHVGDTISI